jgi:hypothetical protein
VGSPLSPAAEAAPGVPSALDLSNLVERSVASVSARRLAADPARGAVVRRLFDAEGDGWEPARLLVTEQEETLHAQLAGNFDEYVRLLDSLEPAAARTGYRAVME